MRDTAHALYEETQAAKTLLAQMADILGDDEDAQRDLIEGETSLREVIAKAVQKIGEDGAAIDGLQAYIKELKHRSERIEQRVENMRTAVAVAMELAREKKLETPFGTVTMKATAQTVIVVEEADIPAQFWKPQPPKLDKALLTKAMKGGEFVSGAMLSNGGTTISIRRG